LFLDMELDTTAHKMIAEDLSRSDYSIEKIEEILFDEVYPVCIVNLTTAAGVWEQFDKNWLTEEISNRLQNRPKKRKKRFLKSLIQDDWEAVKRILLTEG
ncbi:MAG: hypothetical protein AAFP70_22505, partial [Calditrichota bacterium]